MSSLFSGLDAFGMDDLDKNDLFQDQVEKKKTEKKKTKEVEEIDLLYARTMRCPVCDSVFEARTVKQGSAVVEGVKVNLRPIYRSVDPIRYDVMLCEVCGYAALNRNFKKISDRQIKEVRKKISMKYVGKKYPEVYTYEIALERYKMALYNDVVLGRSDLNKAFLCLKASWVVESLIENCADGPQLDDYKDTYKAFVENAFKGFSKSYGDTSFPVFGMNQSTFQYLLGALAYESGDLQQTGYWLGKVLLSTTSSGRIKDKARELKAKIEADKAKDHQ